MSIYKTKDGFVFDDDFREAVIMDYRLTSKYFISIVAYAELRDPQEKDRTLRATIKLEKHKHHLGESWSEERISWILEDRGFRIHRVEVNKSRDLLTAEFIVERQIDKPVSIDKVRYVAELQDELLSELDEIIQTLEAEGLPANFTRDFWDDGVSNDFIVELKNEGSIEDWWEEYYGEEF